MLNLRKNVNHLACSDSLNARLQSACIFSCITKTKHYCIYKNSYFLTYKIPFMFFYPLTGIFCLKINFKISEES